jgi:hypothetical protein
MIKAITSGLVGYIQQLNQYIDFMTGNIEPLDAGGQERDDYSTFGEYLKRFTSSWFRDISISNSNVMSKFILNSDANDSIEIQSGPDDLNLITQIKFDSADNITMKRHSNIYTVSEAETIDLSGGKIFEILAGNFEQFSFTAKFSGRPFVVLNTDNNSPNEISISSFIATARVFYIDDGSGLYKRLTAFKGGMAFIPAGTYTCKVRRDLTFNWQFFEI